MTFYHDLDSIGRKFGLIAVTHWVDKIRLCVNPHKPLKTEVTICNHQLDCPFYMWPDVVICKHTNHEMSMIMTKWPYWDQVSPNNKNSAKLSLLHLLIYIANDPGRWMLSSCLPPRSMLSNCNFSLSRLSSWLYFTWWLLPMCFSSLKTTMSGLKWQMSWRRLITSVSAVFFFPGSKKMCYVCSIVGIVCGEAALGISVMYGILLDDSCWHFPGTAQL